MLAIRMIVQAVVAARRRVDQGRMQMHGSQRRPSPRFGAMMCWLALLLAPIAAVAADATDRIGMPGPIRFSDTEFAL